MSFSWREIVLKAAECSSFYSDLYKGIDLYNCKLSDLPIVDQKEFWNSNKFNGNRLLTSEIDDGMVFKSGGTTGNPKFSVFTKEEWTQFCQSFGKGMDRRCLQSGDRVGNLFYAGELYASFLFITKCIDEASTPVIQFPMVGTMNAESIIETVNEYKINVLCAVPTTLLNIVAFLDENNEKCELVTRLLYGGESVYPDQCEKLKRAFPNAEILSIGYASVDGGHLGYFDSDCRAHEHKVFDNTIVEIIDQNTGEPIIEEGRVGKLVYTNLTRVLMPIIRYPVGDVARWTGVGKFELLGRSDEGARVGPCTVNRDDVLHIINQCTFNDEVLNHQMTLGREDGKDYLKILFTIPTRLLERGEDFKAEMLEAFQVERPLYFDSVKKGLIGPLEISFGSESDLKRNPRTGKLICLIDQRKDASAYQHQ